MCFPMKVQLTDFPRKASDRLQNISVVSVRRYDIKEVNAGWTDVLGIY